MDDVDQAFHTALTHKAKPYVEPDNLTLGVPQLPIKNALIYSPNGVVIEFIQELNFYVE